MNEHYERLDELLRGETWPGERTIRELVLAALACARAGALEEVILEFSDEGPSAAYSPARVVAKVRALITTPAPASIPAERVRTGAIQADAPLGRSVEHIQAALRRALAERPGHPVRRAVAAIAGDLGVPLDAATEMQCDECGMASGHKLQCGKRGIALGSLRSCPHGRVWSHQCPQCLGGTP